MIYVLILYSLSVFIPLRINKCSSSVKKQSEENSEQLTPFFERANVTYGLLIY